MKFKIKIPTKLSEIKLKDYQKYMKIAQENEGATEFLNIKAAEIFCKVKINDVKAIKVRDFENVINVINYTFSQKKDFIQRFWIGGKEFGFIPKLDDISIGEFIDLSKYISEYGELHRAMAVMYRPINLRVKDKYDIEEYKGSEKYCDQMKEVSLDIALGAQVFFYSLGSELLKLTLGSLQDQAQTNSQLKQILEESGAGMDQFTQSLEEIYTGLNIHLN